MAKTLDLSSHNVTLLSSLSCLCGKANCGFLCC